MFGVFFFFKQKTAYDMRISDWSADVCSSDLGAAGAPQIDLQAVVLVVDEQRFPVGTAIGMAPHFPGRHGAVGRMDLLLRWRGWRLAFRASRQPDNEDEGGQYPLQR